MELRGTKEDGQDGASQGPSPPTCRNSMQEVHLAMVQQERIYPEMLMTRVLSSLFSL